MSLSQTLPKAWSAFSRNKRLLLIIVLLEFFLLFALFKIYMQFFIPTQEVFTGLSELMQQRMAELPDEELYKVEGLLFEDAEFMALYRKLIYLWFSMIGVMALTSILFKAPLWYLAHKSVLKSMPLKSLGKTFALMLFWLFASGLVLLAYGYIASGFFEEPGLPAQIVLAAALLAVSYFAQIGLSLVPARQTFKKMFVIGVKQAKEVVPAFLVNAVIAFNALALAFLWASKVSKSMWGVAALAALLALISFPALAFTRVHMVIAVWQKR